LLDIKILQYCLDNELKKYCAIKQGMANKMLNETKKHNEEDKKLGHQNSKHSGLIMATKSLRGQSVQEC
jgi:hypothetical protein